MMVEQELTATCEGIQLSVTRMDKLSVKERLHMLRANVAEALPDVSRWEMMLML